MRGINTSPLYHPLRVAFGLRGLGLACGLGSTLWDWFMLMTRVLLPLRERMTTKATAATSTTSRAPTPITAATMPMDK